MMDKKRGNHEEDVVSNDAAKAESASQKAHWASVVGRHSVMMALEPRFMFDAAVAATVDAVADQVEAHSTEGQAAQNNDAAENDSDADADSPDANGAEQLASGAKDDVGSPGVQMARSFGFELENEEDDEPIVARTLGTQSVTTADLPDEFTCKENSGYQYINGTSIAGSGDVTITIVVEDGMVRFTNTGPYSSVKIVTNGPTCDKGVTKVTFTGDVGDINGILKGLEYKSNTGVCGEGASSISIYDGTVIGEATLLDVLEIDIDHVNNKPAFVGKPGPSEEILGLEDTANGFVITKVNDPNDPGRYLQISDFDAGKGDVNDIYTIHLTVKNGTLSYGDNSGWTAAGDGKGGVFAYTGSLDEINNILKGIQFKGNQDWSGTESVKIQVWDKEMVEQSANALETTLDIKVREVNDIPDIAGTETATVKEGGSVEFNKDMFAITDVEQKSDSQLTVYINSGIDAYGKLQMKVGGAWVDMSLTAGEYVINYADIVGGKIRFCHNGAEVRNDNKTGFPDSGSFTYRVTDNVGGWANDNTFTLNFKAVNDDPSLSLKPSGQKPEDWDDEADGPWVPTEKPAGWNDARDGAWFPSTIVGDDGEIWLDVYEGQDRVVINFEAKDVDQADGDPLKLQIKTVPPTADGWLCWEVRAGDKINGVAAESDAILRIVAGGTTDLSKGIISLADMNRILAGTDVNWKLGGDSEFNWETQINSNGRLTFTHSGNDGADVEKQAGSGATRDCMFTVTVIDDGGGVMVKNPAYTDGSDESIPEFIPGPEKAVDVDFNIRVKPNNDNPYFQHDKNVVYENGKIKTDADGKPVYEEATKNDAGKYVVKDKNGEQHVVDIDWSTDNNNIPKIGSVDVDNWGMVALNRDYLNGGFSVYDCDSLNGSINYQITGGLKDADGNQLAYIYIADGAGGYKALNEGASFTQRDIDEGRVFIRYVGGTSTLTPPEEGGTRYTGKLNLTFKVTDSAKTAWARDDADKVHSGIAGGVGYWEGNDETGYTWVIRKVGVTATVSLATGGTSNPYLESKNDIGCEVNKDVIVAEEGRVILDDTMINLWYNRYTQKQVDVVNEDGTTSKKPEFAADGKTPIFGDAVKITDSAINGITFTLEERIEGGSLWLLDDNGDPLEEIDIYGNFSWQQLTSGKVVFIQDGSETFTGSIKLSVSDGSSTFKDAQNGNREYIVLDIKTNAVNDTPQVEGGELNVKEGQENWNAGNNDEHGYGSPANEDPKGGGSANLLKPEHFGVSDNDTESSSGAIGQGDYNNRPGSEWKVVIVGKPDYGRIEVWEGGQWRALEDYEYADSADAARSSADWNDTWREGASTDAGKVYVFSYAQLANGQVRYIHEGMDPSGAADHNPYSDAINFVVNDGKGIGKDGATFDVKDGNGNVVRDKDGNAVTGTHNTSLSEMGSITVNIEPVPDAPKREAGSDVVAYEKGNRDPDVKWDFSSPDVGTVINENNLSWYDTDSTNVQLQYTILNEADNLKYGSLYIYSGGTVDKTPDGKGGFNYTYSGGSWTLLAKGNNFTQEDILQGRVKYVHNSDESHFDDKLIFSLTDSSGIAEKNAINARHELDIQIKHTNNAPEMTKDQKDRQHDDGYIYLTDKDNGKNISGIFEFTDRDNNPTSMTDPGYSNGVDAVKDRLFEITFDAKVKECQDGNADVGDSWGRFTFKTVGTGGYTITLNEVDGVLQSATFTDKNSKSYTVTVTTDSTGKLVLTGTKEAVDLALEFVWYKANSENPDLNGGVTVTCTVNDLANGDESEYGNKDSDYARESEKSVDVWVSTDNDAPTVKTDSPTGLSTTEDATKVHVKGSDGKFIQIEDPDAFNSNKNVTTIKVENGTLSITGSYPGVKIQGNGSGELVLTGTLADINKALKNLYYNPNPDYNGTAKLTLTHTDDYSRGGDSNKSLAAEYEVAIEVVPVNDEVTASAPEEEIGITDAEWKHIENVSVDDSKDLASPNNPAWVQDELTVTLDATKNDGNGNYTDSCGKINVVPDFSLAADKLPSGWTKTTESGTTTITVKISDTESISYTTTDGKAVTIVKTVGTTETTTYMTIGDDGVIVVKDGTADDAKTLLTITNNGGNGSGGKPVTLVGTNEAINDALAILHYHHDTRAPGTDDVNEEVKINLTVIDEGNGHKTGEEPSTDSKDIHLFVSDGNDDPTITAAKEDPSVVVVEDTETVLFGPDNKITIADPDARPNLDMQLEFTLSDNNAGTLVFPAGVEVDTTTTPGTYIVKGTMTELQDILDKIKFNPAKDFNIVGGSDVTLEIVINDLGNYSAGDDKDAPGLTDKIDIAIKVTPVNDAPVVYNPDGEDPYATENESNKVLEIPFGDGKVNEDQTSAAKTIDELFAPKDADGKYNGIYNDSRDTVPGGTTENDFAGVVVVAPADAAGKGTWQYYDPTFDNGEGNAPGKWIEIKHGNGTPAISDTNGFFLSAGTKVRFQPADDYYGEAPDLVVRLVDSSGKDSDGTPNYSLGDKVDVRANGGTTEFSKDKVAVTLDVQPVNDAPTIVVTDKDGDPVTGSDLKTTILEDRPAELFPNGVLNVILGDKDSTANSDLEMQLEFTLSGTNAGKGELVFPDGVTVTESGGKYIVTGKLADLQAVINGVKFKPADHFNGGDISLNVKLSDLGHHADKTDATSLSADFNVAITVGAVNDAPVVKPDNDYTFDEIQQDQTSAAQSVFNVFNPAFQDNLDGDNVASTANTLAGVVIVGNTADKATQGAWQWQDSDGNWHDIPTGLNATGKGFYLDATTNIRFAPATGYYGTPPGLTAHLVDNSTYDAASDTGKVSTPKPVQWTDGNGTTYVDLSATKTGDETRYSSGTVSVGISVANVNSAPTVETGGDSKVTKDSDGKYVYQFDPLTEDQTVNNGKTVGDMFKDAFGDAKDKPAGNSAATGNSFAGIVVTGVGDTAGKGVWQYKTKDGDWTEIKGVSPGSALFLDSDASIRFVPNQDYNGTPPGLTVHLVEDSATPPTSGTKGVNAGSVGDSTQFSKDSITVGVTVNPENDAPVVYDTKTGEPSSKVVITLPEQCEDLPDDGITPEAPAYNINDLFTGKATGDKSSIFNDSRDTVPNGTTANDFAGIVVVGCGDTTDKGVWWYKDGANGWKELPTDMKPEQGFYLPAGTEIKFVPAEDFIGDAPKLTVHLVDASTAGDTNHALSKFDPDDKEGTWLDLTGDKKGNTTPYSKDSVDICLVITTKNTRPDIKDIDDLEFNAGTKEGGVGQRGDAEFLAPDGTLFDRELEKLKSWDGATLTINRVDGATKDSAPNAQDVFGNVNGDLTAGGEVVVVENDERIVVGKVVGNSDGTLVIEFNDKATPNRVDQVLRDLTYTNTGTDCSQTITLGYTVDDMNAGSDTTSGKQGYGDHLDNVFYQNIDIIAAPVAENDGNTIDIGAGEGSATGTVITNDSHPDFNNPDDTIKDAVEITVKMPDPDPETSIVPPLVKDGLYGTVTVNPDGTYEYVLDPGKAAGFTPGESVTDSFTYTIVDQNGKTAEAELVITIKAPAPVVPPAPPPGDGGNTPGGKDPIIPTDPADPADPDIPPKGDGGDVTWIEPPAPPKVPEPPLTESSTPEVSLDPANPLPGLDTEKNVNADSDVVVTVENAAETADQHMSQQQEQVGKELGVKPPTFQELTDLTENTAWPDDYQLYGNTDEKLALLNIKQDFPLPEDLFIHTKQGEKLEYTASLPDGSPLPDWMEFDPDEFAIIATPPEGSEGTMTIIVRAQDTKGNQADASVVFKIGEENHSATEAALADADGAEARGEGEGEVEVASLEEEERPDVLDEEVMLEDEASVGEGKAEGEGLVVDDELMLSNEWLLKEAQDAEEAEKRAEGEEKGDGGVHPGLKRQIADTGSTGLLAKARDLVDSLFLM